MTNAAIDHVPIVTPRDQLSLLIGAIASEHGVKPERIFGEGRSGQTTPLVYAARRRAVMAVIEARPWWRYQQVADYFNLCLNTVHKYAMAAGHRRNKPYPPGHGHNPNRYKPRRTESGTPA